MFFLRIDLGYKSGLGHFNRSRSLMKCLGIKEYKFVVDKIPKGSFLNEEMSKILTLYEKGNFINEKDDAYKFSNLILKSSKAPIVVKDSYRLGYIWEKFVFKKCKNLIVIDDFPEKKHHTNYYINHNPSLLNSNLEIIKSLKKKNKRNTKFLLGTDYALLNIEKKLKVKTKSDLVFYNGGSGNLLIYEKIIKKLSKTKKKLKIILIVGPFAKNYEIICKKFKKYKNIAIQHQPNNISNILRGTKIFISSASVAMFESSHLNVPTLLFKMNFNQNLRDFDYEKLGHYFNLDKSDLNLTNKVAQLIIFMIKNRLKIKKMISKSSINLKEIEKNYKKIFKLNNE